MSEENPEGFNYTAAGDADARAIIRTMALKDSGFAIAWALLEVADAIRGLSDVGEALYEISDVIAHKDTS